MGRPAASVPGRHIRGTVMVISCLCRAALAVAVALLVPGAATADEIGRVKTVRAAFVERGGAKMALAENASIELNDLLSTGPDGALGAVFADGSTMSMGPRSRLVIDEFVFDPDHDRLSMVTRAMAGTFAFASGLIGKLAPQKVVVNTPVSTIGIRGTSFLVQVEEQ